MSDHKGPTTFLLTPYDPAWARRGTELADELRERIGPTAVRVEHIGSTAIPCMAAKPTFDLQVSVVDLDAAAPVIDAALAPMGLVRRDARQDHVPAERDDDPARWARRLWGKAAAETGWSVR